MDDTGETKKHAGGRPTKYNEGQLLTAKGAYAMGATDVKVAEILGVAPSTVYLWKLEHPEFSEITKDWKQFADGNVERSLYERATGYSHPDTDIRVADGEVIMTEIIKHYPPDPASMIFWLKNRKKAEWRDRIDHNHTGSLNQMTDEQLDERAAELVAKALAEGKT